MYSKKGKCFRKRGNVFERGGNVFERGVIKKKDHNSPHRLRGNSPDVLNGAAKHALPA